ncbi:hypothetical protein BJ165DRAFT_1351099 [Panaeolus papilionaceus]|nr:hypothetical protein BJ165DRAFT_1351099 [Panaeolus papilionaceus]
MPLLYTLSALLTSFLRLLFSFLSLLPSPHSFFAPFFHFTSPEPLLTPSRCLLISPTLPALTTCLDTFTVPHNTYTPLSYALSQPSPLQLEDWARLVQRMMNVNGNCTNLGRDIPESLRLNYEVREWREYCVLYETSTVPLPSSSSSSSPTSQKPDPCACTQPKHVYSKGWGTLITPSSALSQARDLHISAPHPHFDLGTVEQAAAVFAGTGARSLSIAGRARTAFLVESGCVRGGGGGKYWMTDPAHNDKEPFFTTSLQIHAWQYTQPRGCPASKCAFIQFHGKGERTCVGDDVFISTGLGGFHVY